MTANAQQSVSRSPYWQYSRTAEYNSISSVTHSLYDCDKQSPAGVLAILHTRSYQHIDWQEASSVDIKTMSVFASRPTHRLQKVGIKNSIENVIRGQNVRQVRQNKSHKRIDVAYVLVGPKNSQGCSLPHWYTQVGLYTPYTNCPIFCPPIPTPIITAGYTRIRVLGLHKIKVKS